MSEKPWRLFVGAFPPPGVVRTFESAIDDWKGKIADRYVKWVSAEKIHLTLCFLGNVDANCVPELIDKLATTSAAREEFAVTARGLGAFPNARRPRVLWAGVEGDVQELLALQRVLSSVCLPFMKSVDDKPFSAHLTLARLKDPDATTVSSMQKVVEANSDREFGDWPNREIQLIRSELGGKGSTYTPLATFQLQVKR